MIKYIIILLLVTSAVEADSIDVNLTSFHTDTTYTYNSENYGLGYSKDLNKDWQVLTGFYRNSYNKHSNYLMFKLKHDTRNWVWGVNLGFVTGYDNVAQTVSHEDDDDEYEYREYQANINMNEYQFVVLPTATYKITSRHRIEFGVLPVFSKRIIDVVTLKYQYRL